ncbi:MAG: ABC transporter permease [Gammaproteobacteria bacterium]
MSATPFRPSAADFAPATNRSARDAQLRPSLSYWQDAWQRLRRNTRAVASLAVVVLFVLFAVAGPWLWRADPAAQDVNQISRGPGPALAARIVEPYAAWAGVTVPALPDGGPTTPVDLRLADAPTTEAVRLQWEPGQGAAGYRVYRNLYDPSPDRALGLPLAEIFDPKRVSFEDRFDLHPERYWYSVVALNAKGDETHDYAGLVVQPELATSAADAASFGWIADATAVRVGDVVALPYHPLGTDYLGRDMLARLMYGARVSLFIGFVAPFLFVLLGIVYGSAAGFTGGRVDQLLMRFADFVLALPFLLFMILFKIAFGIGPGESGIAPMLIALVLLSWPSTARLVRGQVLQIRGEGYVGASRLLGARTGYLVLRHMIPNTFGVILVTLTFEVPRAIFTEAFLSFIGMGVAPPTASWGSMSNEGIKTMLAHPHELLLPALFISVTVLALNLLGDGLRDALDVRMRGRE